MIDEAGISEKEFEVIRSLEENGQNNQRFIAKEAGISLGLTNLILKKMIKKGYLKARQLTPKKIQYILTPKGILEKAKKSYWFTKRTINTMRGMKQRIQEAILREYEHGVRRFAIQGKGELADLVEIAMRDLALDDVLLVRVTDDSVQNDNGRTLIIADENMLQEKGSQGNTINVMSVLAEALA